MAKKDRINISAEGIKKNIKQNQNAQKKENNMNAEDVQKSGNINSIEETIDEAQENKVNEDNEVNEVEVNEAQDVNSEDAKAVEQKENDLKKELEAVNNKLVRLQADFLNYKARTEKEKLSTYGNAVSDVLSELLPTIDNFERAIDSISEENASEEVLNIKKGVKMIYDQFVGSLKKRGLAEIEALGSKFDPNLHSGIAFDVVEDKEEDTVIEVFQKGYTVKDKVVRPSMVKIAKK